MWRPSAKGWVQQHLGAGDVATQTRPHAPFFRSDPDSALIPLIQIYTLTLTLTLPHTRLPAGPRLPEPGAGAAVLQGVPRHPGAAHRALPVEAGAAHHGARAAEPHVRGVRGGRAPRRAHRWGVALCVFVVGGDGVAGRGEARNYVCVVVGHMCVVSSRWSRKQMSVPASWGPCTTHCASGLRPLV